MTENKMTCDHCGAKELQYEIDATTIYPLDWVDGLDHDGASIATHDNRSVRCGTCGAESSGFDTHVLDMRITTPPKEWAG